MVRPQNWVAMLATYLASAGLASAQETGNPGIASFISVANSLVSFINSADAAQTTAAPSTSTTPASRPATTTPAATSSSTPSATATPAPDEGLSTSTRNIIIIVCAVVGALLIALALCLCLCLRRRRRKRAATPLEDREIDQWRFANNPNHMSTTQPPMTQQPSIPLMTAVDGRRPDTAEHPAFRDSNHENPFTPAPPPRRKPTSSRSREFGQDPAFGGSGQGFGTTATAYASNEHLDNRHNPHYSEYDDINLNNERAPLSSDASALPTHNNADRPPTPFGLDFGKPRQRSAERNNHHGLEAAGAGALAGAALAHHHENKKDRRHTPDYDQSAYTSAQRTPDRNNRISDPFRNSAGYDVPPYNYEEAGMINSSSPYRKSREYQPYGAVEPTIPVHHGPNGRHTGIGYPYSDRQVEQFVTEPPSSEMRKSLQERERRFSGGTPLVPDRSPRRSPQPHDSAYVSNHTADESSTSADTFQSARDSYPPPPVPWDSSRRSSSGDRRSMSRSPHSATGTPTRMQPPPVPWDENTKRYSGERSTSRSPRQSFSYAPKTDSQGRPRRLRFSDVSQQEVPQIQPHHYSHGVGEAI